MFGTNRARYTEAEWERNDLEEAFLAIEATLGVKVEIVLHHTSDQLGSVGVFATIDMVYDIHRRELNYPPPVTKLLEFADAPTIAEQLVQLTWRWYHSCLEHNDRWSRPSRP